MEIESSVGLLSGANRGLGRAPTAGLLGRRTADPPHRP